MTLILGLEYGHEAVWAADSKLTSWGDSAGAYTQTFRKLILVNDGNWIIGCANSGVGYDLINFIEQGRERFNPNIDQGVHEYAARTLQLYRQRGYRGAPSFLLAGAHESGVRIYGWNLAPDDDGNGPFSGAMTVVRQNAIGTGHHGALYFSFAFHDESGTTQQRILLAHLCVTEAAKQDPRCGPPVQIGVVSRSEKARILTEKELKPVQARSEEIISTLRDMISTWDASPASPAKI